MTETGRPTGWVRVAWFGALAVAIAGSVVGTLWAFRPPPRPAPPAPVRAVEAAPPKIATPLVRPALAPPSLKKAPLLPGKKVPKAK